MALDRTRRPCCQLLQGSLAKRGGSVTGLTGISRGLIGKWLELTVERPAAFDLASHLRTAQFLELTVPQSVLRQAAEVIP